MTKPEDPRAAILTKARAQSVMIATAESCTGGLLAAALTDLPGSSAFFDRGFVTYSNAAKQDMLGVQSETLTTHGAVSEETAREMAQGALTHTDADIAIAITGIAGPGGSDHKPEGRVCFACATPKHCDSETRDFGPLGRDRIRQISRDHALSLILQAL